MASQDQTFNVTIDDSDIAHAVDRDSRFVRNEAKWSDGAYWTDVQDEHLMVWYQMETLSDFYKLYGRVDGIMPGGTRYEIQIFDTFNSTALNNNKYIVFSELSAFGGKNFALAYIFGVAAVMVLLILMFFFCCYFTRLHKKSRDSEAFIASLTY